MTFKKLTVFAIASVFAFAVHSQTVADRINSAGVVYVKGLQDKRIFVVTDLSTDGVADWTSLANTEVELGDTVSVSGAFEPMGDVVLYKDGFPELFEVIENGMIDAIKKNVDESVEFKMADDNLPESYFLLECMINISDAGLFVISKKVSEGSDRGELADRMDYKLELSEMVAGEKKPDKIVSITSNGSYNKEEFDVRGGNDPVETAISSLLDTIVESTKNDMEEMVEKSQKKISKKLSK